MRQDSTAVVIVAAGRGRRAGDGLPKQYRSLSGEPVLRRTVRAFADHPAIGDICVVIHPDDRTLFDAAVEDYAVDSCLGGDTRSASVRNGLRHLSRHAPCRVLVHDAARPFLSPVLIDSLIAALQTSDGAIPVLPQTDATFTRDGDRITAPVDRETLVRAQTPQAFDYKALVAAFETVGGARDFPDEASLARAAGLDVICVEGEVENIKLTFERDFAAATPSAVFRHGQGYDVHRLGPGDGVWLGGVLIPCPYSLIGHSDADVLLHALTDAILGSVGEGDIGQHFPPTDARWKGVASEAFVRHAVDLARQSGARIVHADLTVICETPKVGPHRNAMRTRIADLLGLPMKAVNIKATTTEGLGFTGRREGIAAQASVTVKSDE